MRVFIPAAPDLTTAATSASVGARPTSRFFTLRTEAAVLRASKGSTVFPGSELTPASGSYGPKVEVVPLPPAPPLPATRPPTPPLAKPFVVGLGPSLAPEGCPAVPPFPVEGVPPMPAEPPAIPPPPKTPPDVETPFQAPPLEDPPVEDPPAHPPRSTKTNAEYRTKSDCVIMSPHETVSASHNACGSGDVRGLFRCYVKDALKCHDAVCPDAPTGRQSCVHSCSDRRQGRFRLTTALAVNGKLAAHAFPCGSLRVACWMVVASKGFKSMLEHQVSVTPVTGRSAAIPRARGRPKVRVDGRHKIE